MERKQIERTIPAVEIQENDSIKLSQLKTQLGHSKAAAERIAGHKLKDKEIWVSIEPAINEDGNDVNLINITFPDLETEFEAKLRLDSEMHDFERKKEEFKKFLIDYPGDANEIMKSINYL